MRAKILVGIFFAVWISLLSRTYYLSVESNSYYEQLSLKNTIKIEKIAPVRGDILDRNFKPLAINKLGFKLEVTPHLSIEKHYDLLHSITKEVENLLPQYLQSSMIQKYLKSDSHYNHLDITVVDFISYETILPHFTKLNLIDGLKITLAPKRYYPYQQSASHIIGYTARSNQKEIDKDPVLKLTGVVGKVGIEKQYNKFLEGIPGEQTVQINVLNEEVRVLESHDSVENRSLVLSIDIRLQKYITTLMKGKAGAVVVMRVDGEILSAGSYPEFNPNSFVSGISQKKWRALIDDLDMPFTNKVINGLYPPASVIKPSMALAFIQNGLSRWWYINCSGTTKVGNRNFRCWNRYGHGKVGIIRAIRESCDDYFYKASLKIGISKMSSALKRYGLGAATGIDLPNEFIGTVPSREWKQRKYGEQWYIGETINTSIGQGSTLVTPLQIAQNTALIATAVLPVPRLARIIEGNVSEPILKDVLSKTEKIALKPIRRAMVEVCNHAKGTATKHITSTIKIAGKTGTAQVIGIPQETKKRIKEEDMAYYTRSHAWLTTYAPIIKPEYVVTVLVEHGGHGGLATGKIVSDIYDKLLELKYIEVN